VTCNGLTFAPATPPNLPPGRPVCVRPRPLSVTSRPRWPNGLARQEARVRLALLVVLLALFVSSRLAAELSEGELAGLDEWLLRLPPGCPGQPHTPIGLRGSVRGGAGHQPSLGGQIWFG